MLGLGTMPRRLARDTTGVRLLEVSATHCSGFSIVAVMLQLKIADMLNLFGMNRLRMEVSHPNIKQFPSF